MKILISIDSFKGSLTSVQAGDACAAGIRCVFPEAEISVRPLADGGEGTTEALVSGLNGTYQTVTVPDPLGRPISAQYGILSDQTAVIEMAAASGLPLLHPSERDPMRTTTYGFGEMIRDAIRQGCRRFILGIGGSATNDGGAGCLQALGFDLLNAQGEPISAGAQGLSELAHVSDAHILPELRECTFYVACDVTNPLCGEQGCSAVFAPQKGADAAMIREMDDTLARFAAVTRTIRPDADANAPGAGAAGGLGFGLMAYLRAELTPGVELILRETGLAAAIQEADLVITGEGCLDAQTAMGKAPAGIAALAKQYGKPVIAFCGAAGEGAKACHAVGIDAYFPILRRVEPLEAALDPANAAQNLTDTAEQAFRLIRMMHAFDIS
ncbi:MAG: glycerate kinase [Oscillospiraceae bacterium]|nr:glycerate kinase [Oscillospiraceae bacterium]